MLRQQQDSHWLVLSDSGHICPFFFLFFFQLLAWEPGHEEDVTLVTVRPNFQDSVHVGYITGLKKFTEYFTCVLCFTTPGDGPRSTPQRIRTHEDSECPLYVFISTHNDALFRPASVCLKRLNVGVCMHSPWTCRSPELHRNPGHISQSELEGSAWEERHPHRYPYHFPKWQFLFVLLEWLYAQPLPVLCLQGIAFPGRNSTGQTRESRITCLTWRRSTGSPVWLHSLPTPFRWPVWPPKVKVSCHPPPFPLVCHQVSFYSFKIMFSFTPRLCWYVISCKLEFYYFY